MAITNSLALVLGLGMALSGGSTVAAASLSDAEIGKMLIGSWAPSSGYAPDNRVSIETYRADGTDIATWYSDPTCKKITLKVTGRWRIKAGWLITTLPKGIEFRDKIAGIKKDEVSFFDDHGTHAMKRGTFCGAPVS